MTHPARLVIACLAFGIIAQAMATAALAQADREPIRIIYDTDFGEDIDDAWALALAVRSPELDVKLVTINFGGVRYKLKMVAKFLDALGRDDIPIAVGRSNKRFKPRYYDWAGDYKLADDGGPISRKAVDKMIEVIEADETGRLKIVPVGSMLNVAGVVQRRPALARREPAEGRHRPLVAARGEGDAFRRADPRDRRRRQGRDLSIAQRPGRGRQGAGGRLQRHAGVDVDLRSDRGDVRRPACRDLRP